MLGQVNFGEHVKKEHKDSRNACIIDGGVYKVDKKLIDTLTAKLVKKEEIKAKDCKVLDNMTPVHRLSGNWLESVLVDGKE